MSKVKEKLNKKSIVVIVVIVVICVILLSLTIYLRYSYSVSNNFKSAIYPGVSIENIAMGGKTKEEAKNILVEKYDKPLEKGSIDIRVKEQVYSLPYADINIKYNIDEVINSAFEYGKDLNFYSQYKIIKEPKEMNYNLSLSYDKEVVQGFLENADKTLNKEIVDATIAKVGENFQVASEKVKEEIDITQAFEEITKKIENRETEVSLETTIKVTNPKIMADDLKKIDTVISSFSTKFNPNERSINIQIASKAASGVVVMPGDTYSFNELVGDTTPDKGYREAPVIVNNKLEPGYGGGVCQVSTTLHNAVVRAGIIPTERMHHSMPVSYVPKGMDAMISYNMVDYKFKNTLNFPIYIHSYVLNNELIFSIYSNSTLKNKTYDLVSDIYKEIPQNIKYIKDNKLKKGQEVVDNIGSNGYKVKVYLVTYENGESNKRLLYNDYYEPVDKIIKKNI